MISKRPHKRLLRWNPTQETLMAVLKSKTKDKEISRGDCRDWNAIRSWAEEVALRF
jgi:hypothetical protein